MKTIFSLNIGKTIVKCLFVASLMYSCGGNDDDPPTSGPIISLQGDNTIIVKNGESFDVALTLNAEGGTKELVVNRGGGLLEVVALPAGSTSFTYSNETVPATAEEGDEFEYEFILVDDGDQESTPVALTVSTRVYDETQIGATTLFDATIVSDGIVPSGTNMKFVTGRNYLISSTLGFGEGTSLTIEEGVTVYLDATAADLVEIEIQPGSTVSIIGTVSNPVVMTSSATLDGTPEPGDWNRFRLDGIENVTVQYLRTEYASQGFRVSDCNDTNTVEYVNTHFSKEEGFFITAGNINFKYLAAVNSGEDSYRLGNDYSGKIQFAIAQLDQDQVLNDGNALAIRETASPTLANVTLIGPGAEIVLAGDDNDIHGARFRGVSQGKVYNSIVTAYPERGVRLSDDVVVTDLSGETVFAYSYVFDIADDPFRDNRDILEVPGNTEIENPFAGFLDEAEVFQNPFFNNVTGFDAEGNPILTEITGIGTNDFIPDTVLEAAESFDPSTVDAFFSSVTFVGAVENEAGDWTKGWVKNPDGTIR